MLYIINIYLASINLILILNIIYNLLNKNINITKVNNYYIINLYLTLIK